MVNHFRTLLLNLLPTATPPRFGEFVPSDYLPVSGSAQEKLVRGILLGGDSERNSQEFGATVVFRLMHDNLYLRNLMEGIDPRLSFDPEASFYLEPSRSEMDYPTLPVIWSALERSKALPMLFRSMGRYQEKLLELQQEMYKAERIDYKIAFVAAALCLRTEERRLTE